MKTMNTVGTENEIVSSVCNAFVAAGYSVKFGSLYGKVHNWTTSATSAMTQYTKSKAVAGAIVTLLASNDNGKSAGVVEFVPGNGRDVIHNWSPSIEAVIAPILDA